MKIAALFLLMFAAVTVHAQSTLKGSVTDGSNNRMSDVFVRDINNKQMTLTDKSGNFEIRTAPGHLLVFTSPTYVPDTVYVTDMKNIRVRMVSQGIQLSEVNINASRRTFDPRAEYPEIYQKSKVYVLSPSSWFSKEGRNARRLKKFFEREAQQREIDEAFSARFITGVVPLKGEDLENFMTLYRPDYDFVKKNRDKASMTVYVNDSYKKFMALPPEKRIPQKLVE